MMLATLLTLLAALTVSMQSDAVYTVHYLKSFRADLLSKGLGCNSRIMYGNYIYPGGESDAWHVLTNEYKFGAVNCQRPDTYLKVFGTQQDYAVLLNAPAESISNSIHAAVGRISARKLVIDWKAPLDQSVSDYQELLKEIISKLSSRGYDVHLKAPASYFCYSTDEGPYLLGLPTNKFIVEMYGEETGQYITYESIFEDVQIKQERFYPEQDCPKFPSLATLSRYAEGKIFMVEKTMEPEESGYIGPNFEGFLRKSAYREPHFYDSFEEERIIL